jgi:ABC-2 type transport system permease protein
MYSIFKKELSSFFSSLVGYIAIVVFLIICGFFLWVTPDNNMLDFGYASMDKFFALAPWILLFLIPALTMRSFSDEYKAGTIEVLFTLPLKDREIILGKFLASSLIVIFAIFPTVLYVITLASLSVIRNNIDTGAIIGSYIGLLFLCGAFTAIGLFASSISNNQVIAFLIAVFVNFIVFAGFETISKIPMFDNGIDYILSQIGMQFHYDSISRGLIDTRDMVYFVSVIALFILAARMALGKRKWN